MRKIIFVLFVLFTLGCSKEDEDEEMCCRHSIVKLREFYETRYEEFMANPKTSEEQRMLAEKEYKRAMEDPCAVFKEELEGAGATCEGPH